jgi:putative ABC transport system permease protein
VENWLKDLKFGAKLLFREKGFTLTVLLTLTVAIAANAAVFSIVRSVLLKPLPYPDSDRLTVWHNSYPNAGVETAGCGVPDYYDRRMAIPALEQVGIYRFEGQIVGEPGTTRRLKGVRATPSFLPMLGARAERGRLFTEEEGEIGKEKRVVLTFGLWQELYGGNAGVLGSDLRVNGVPYEIVGILPESFFFLDPDVRLFVPAAFTAEEKSDESRHSNNWEMLGRLRPEATVAEAQSQLDGLNASNLERFPDLAPLLKNAGFHSTVVPWRDDLTASLSGTLDLLWGGVAFVLLIACVNIANLLLVRSQVRLKELAIRSSMGAGRARIARQLLTEILLLTVIGGSLGVALGYGALSVLRSFGIEELPRGSEIEMDLVSVSLTFAGALVIGGGLALIPVARMLGMNLADVVHQEGRTSTGGRGTRILRKGLVVVQVGFALVLLIGAGLLLESFRRVAEIDPGFRPAGVFTGSVSLPGSRYARGREQATEEFGDRASFAKRALAAVRALPGVQGAGLVSDLPFGGDYSDSVVVAEGYQMQPGESVISPSRVSVSPGYFETMGIPLQKGRLFDERDDEKAPNVVIVDDRLARRFWPQGEPLGKRMYTPNTKEDLVHPGPDVTWYTVVGVVGSIRERGLVESDDRLGMYYFPYSQEPTRYFTFVVRTPSRPDGVAAGVRAAIAGIDPELPLFDVHSMEERVNDSLLTRRTSLLLSASFGLIALFLAALGVYGVLAYLVSQRTREIGIRMALGSTTGSTFELVLREGATIVTIGLAIGLVGALALGRVLEKQLYGIGAADPTVLLSVAGALAVVALVASVIPARRAARIDPVAALRGE